LHKAAAARLAEALPQAVRSKRNHDRPVNEWNHDREHSGFDDHRSAPVTGPNSTQSPSGNTLGPNASPSGSTLTPTGPGSGLSK
jgi:hypothetical protein